MKNILASGISKTLQTEVGNSDSARSYGSGLLEVYATPAMIAFMEKTSMELVQPYLPEGYGTVGIKINVDHLKASIVGDTIKCKANLVEVENKLLRFEVQVTKDGAVIGSGIHERYIIEEIRFIEKLNQNDN